MEGRAMLRSTKGGSSLWDVVEMGGGDIAMGYRRVGGGPWAALSWGVEG